MSAAVIAWLRTTIPALWGTGLAWLASRGLLPAELSGPASTVAEVLLVPTAVALVYAASRWLEARLPGWLHRLLPDRAATVLANLVIRLLLGSTATPSYSGPPSGAARLVPWEQPPDDVERFLAELRDKKDRPLNG